ncbi:hypothetical protein OD350_29030 (plasmid) [Clostridium beijerinckii]|uniref:anthrax toxin lethal factor-related metalloendopeptidase n=1 Tax=Clostridium beijerinckii TaxID=1520 RepID=UPI002227AE51|nr:hypothetical protein [Clostridium beijerinckii]UYZ39119.1 hypothetical protein OD350_29030 [Clostridium beijerinckii]
MNRAVTIRKIVQILIIATSLLSSGAFASTTEKVNTQPFALTINNYNEILKSKLNKYEVTETEKKIDPSSINNTSINDTIFGYTDYANHKVVVYDAGKGIINNHTMDHEAGHVLDTLYNEKWTSPEVINFYSCSQDFQAIYEKEKYSTDGYSSEKYSDTQIEEYFAECFAWYIEKPEKLKQSSPLTYEFIDKVYNWKES